MSSAAITSWLFIALPPVVMLRMAATIAVKNSFGFSTAFFLFGFPVFYSRLGVLLKNYTYKRTALDVCPVYVLDPDLS